MFKKFTITSEEVDQIKSYSGEKYDKSGTYTVLTCPFCWSLERNGYWGNTQSIENKGKVIEHMKECNKNPRHVEWDNECQKIREQLETDSSRRKLLQSKFMMGAGFYHKAMCDPDSTVYDLCRVHEETDKAYIGAFVFGIGMFNVIWPKDKIRELTPKEIKEYQGKHIAINNNPAHAKLNVKEHKLESPWQ